jgi:hypothetical protein
MSNEEQHMNPWAAKLRQAPLPDADASWKGMEHLLDQHLPVQEEEKKRRFPFFLLFAGLLLLVGIGVFIWYQNGSIQKQVGETASATHTTTPSSVIGSQAKGLPNTKEKAAAQRVTNAADNQEAIAVDNNFPKAAGTAITSKATPKSQQTLDVESRANSKQDKLHAVGINVNETTKTAATKRSQVQDGSQPTVSLKDETSRNIITGLTKTRNGVTAKETGTRRKSKGVLVQETEVDVKGSHAQITGKHKDNKQKQRSESAAISSTTSGVQTTEAKTLPLTSTGKIEGAHTLLTQGLHKQTILKVIDSLNVVKVNERSDIILPPSKKEQPEDIRRGWTFGVGINQFFRINQQQPAIYKTSAQDFNSDALTGRLADYIPIAQARYHFNNKLVVQGELQFNAPQFTQRVLLDYNSYQQGNFSAVDSAFLRKLTYFNLPISVHYSPVRNLSIGVGVQFSHLTNAVARIEKQRFSAGQPLPDSGYSVATKSIKNNDTLYQRINTNEVRLLGDASYELGRFMLGIRYNQALKGIIKVPIAGGSLNQARNSTLQLYLRFRFLDNRKRISPTLK